MAKKTPKEKSDQIREHLLKEGYKEIGRGNHFYMVPDIGPVMERYVLTSLSVLFQERVLLTTEEEKEKAKTKRNSKWVTVKSGAYRNVSLKAGKIVFKKKQ